MDQKSEMFLFFTFIGCMFIYMCFKIPRQQQEDQNTGIPTAEVIEEV